MEKVFDSSATHDRVRSKYGSVEAFCRHLGCTKQIYYLAVRKLRGCGKKAAPVSKLIITTLRAEGLLVERDAIEEEGRACNG